MRATITIPRAARTANASNMRTSTRAAMQWPRRPMARTRAGGMPHLGVAHPDSLASTSASSRRKSASLPSLWITNVARAAFSSWESCCWRAPRRARARARRHARDACPLARSPRSSRRSRPPCRPRTAAAPRPRPPWAPAATRARMLEPRSHARADERPQQALQPAYAPSLRRRTPWRRSRHDRRLPPGATSAPQRSTTASLTWLSP